MMRFVALAALIMLAMPALGCSPAQLEPFEFDVAWAVEGEGPPTPPVARVVAIERGRRVKQGESDCVETGSIVIAIRDDSRRVPLVYSFRKVSGEAPGEIFDGSVYEGGYNGKGEQLFEFYWLDLEASPAPFSVDVEITPFTKDGTKGEASTIRIDAGGI